MSGKFKDHLSANLLLLGQCLLLSQVCVCVCVCVLAPAL